MTLREHIRQKPAKASRCAVGRLARQYPDVHEELMVLLDERRDTGAPTLAAISQALASVEVDIKSHTLSRHDRKLCECVR